MIKSQSIEVCKIRCEDSMDISIVSEFYEKLKKSLEMNVSIIIEAGNVEKVDASILQILCSFFLEASLRGVDVSWNNPSERLRFSARLIGVDELLFLK